jgi:hypothetical protein
VEDLKYLGTTSKNQTFIQEETEVMECMPSLGPGSFVFQCAFKNLKIKINKNVILHVAFYVCENWQLLLREELRLRVFENRVLRRILEPKKDKVTG